MTNMGLSELIEVGSWEATINAGCVITNQSCQYVKIGQLVFFTAALWINRTNGTTEEVKITLPFVNAASRVFGTVGYFVNIAQLPNICVGFTDFTDAIRVIYGSGGSTVAIKGNQMETIQFSITYITNK